MDAGYYSNTDKVCELALSELTSDYPVNSTIIIMTEGTTDTEILKGAMQLLYPHLAEYYSFMDFGVKPPGGVGPLVNAVKSIAAAGIENRIIAVFDNDTAAYSATAILKDINLPPTIRLLHYPDIELARKYPTLGPSGVEYLDINQLACSIEMYVGKDILIKDGEYTPVQWKGYDARAKRYQGEILDKDRIKSEALNKLKDCKLGKRAIKDKEWLEMRKLLKSIFKAYQA